MKRKITCHLFLMVFLLLLVSCGGDGRNYVSRQTGISFPEPITLTQSDDHGGFHGDGMLRVEMRFSSEDGASLPARLEKSGWVSVGEAEGPVKSAYERELQAGNLPESSEGLLWFLDRADRSSEDGKRPFEERYSYNYSVALYDPADAALYYLETDT